MPTVDSTGIVKLVDNVLSEREVVVKNDGAGTIYISRDPQMVAAGADTFVVAASSQQDVTLAVGEALYAMAPAGQSASVEVI